MLSCFITSCYKHNVLTAEWGACKNLLQRCSKHGCSPFQSRLSFYLASFIILTFQYLLHLTVTLNSSIIGGLNIVFHKRPRTLVTGILVIMIILVKAELLVAFVILLKLVLSIILVFLPSTVVQVIMTVI